MNERIKKLILPAIILFFAGIIYIALWHITGNGLPCIFYQVTGLYCPGCGTGRMMMSLLTLDLYQAFRYNPASFIALPFVLYYLASVIFEYIKGNTKLPGKAEKIILLALLLLILIVGVLRNTSTFSFLAPVQIQIY